MILFGSSATEAYREDSDIDLLIILPFTGKPLYKAREINRFLESPFHIDLIVKRPEDAQKAYEEWDPFVRTAFDRGKVLYERNRPKVA